MGVSDRQLDWSVRTGKLLRLARGAYFEGDRAPFPFEHSLARVMSSKRHAGGELAAALHGFDGFDVPGDGDYSNVPRSSARETLLALAAITTDIRWEWALEWCLRKELTTIADVEAALQTHRYGNSRIRRILKLRPDGAPPTGSVLETMAVQLIRREPRLPTPSRQVKVRHWSVDLAWREEGVFLELDGEWHKDQPRYDAVRQTGVVVTTGWLVGRYTWTDIVYQPNSTLRSLTALFEARSFARSS